MRQARLVLIAVVALGASGCATYSDHLRQANLSVAAGNYGDAVAQLNKALDVGSSDELPSDLSADRPLNLLERGSLQQAAQSYRGSARDLSTAESQLEMLDLKTDPVGTLGSYLFSDSLKTYRTGPTERLALNAVNMLNFLAAGDLEGAAVEARRFQVMRDYLSSVDVKAEGPATLGTYLAGFIFERRGEGDRALRYYEETLAVRQLRSLDAPVTRLARNNPYRGPALNEVLGRNKGKKPSDAPHELLVVLSLGRVPHREPKRIPVGAAVGLAGTYATGDTDFLKYGATKVVVYPELVETPSSIGTARLEVDGNPIEPESLTDLGAAVRKEYDGMRPQIVAAALTRMASRAAMAEGVRAGGRQESDALGDVLAILFETTMVAFDRPDTRSWTMLPDRVLVARIPVAAGTHTVDVDLGGTRRSVAVDVNGNGFAAVVITEPR